MSYAPARAGGWSRLGGPLLPAVVLGASGAALCAWTWRAWPDPMVDFGRELYVPWRLAEGEVLFRDLAWFNGPLSPYVNALWFALFGPGLTALALANLVILALTVALAHRIVSRAAGPLAALAGGLLFLAVFAFGQLVGIANYNWIAPYSHEATHGLALALAVLAALDAWREGRRGAWLAVGGLALGLCFLTKPEAFLGALAAAAVLLAGAAPRALARFALVALFPPLAAWLLLSPALGPGGALRAALGAWPSVLDGRVASLDFYRAGMGLDDPPARALELLRWSAGWLAAFAPAAIAARLARNGSRRARAVAAVALALAVLAALWLARDHVAWLRAARPLPLAVLATAVLLFPAARRGGERERTGLALAALALALLAKMILQARVTNYGFTLALPAALVLAALLLSWIPERVERSGAASAIVFRAGAGAVLAFAAAMHLEETGAWLARKTEVVGLGRDAFRADVRGKFVSEALRALKAGAVRTMVVLPEGVMLNYLARIENPTPYVNFMPPEMILFGEDAWLAALEASPPDAVLVAHKDTSEYGFALFGRDYGARVMEWVRAHYRPIGLLGDEPLEPGAHFGMRLYARGKAP
jgi:hypothetical protein